MRVIEKEILANEGFVTLPNAVDSATIGELEEELSTLRTSKTDARNASLYGVRNLLELSPRVREFSKSKAVTEITEHFLGGNAKVVRAIYFNKTESANWKVPWHQDLTIAVKERVDFDGYHPWTRKAGILHVQPPLSILKNMLTLRFHLDDAGEENGALKVIAKSHLIGRLSADQIKNIRTANETTMCRVKRGDCLVMRPLLLHSSSAGINPTQRRVIHFECASVQLPGGLQWHES